MSNFNNIDTLINNSCINEIIPHQISKLLIFTTLNKLNKIVIFHTLCAKTIKWKDNKYLFSYNGKQYPFSILSDQPIQKVDQKYLLNHKVNSSNHYLYSTIRSLKLAASLDLNNLKIVTGTSLAQKLDILISFSYKNKEYIINYFYNLIMLKQDYYNLFKYKEFSIVNKNELYQIHHILNYIGNEHLYELLIFNQIFFPNINEYDSNGFNNNNMAIIGKNHDSLFFLNIDCYPKYGTILNELTKFTQNPTINFKHIKKTNQSGKYLLKDRKFGICFFYLLSDYINDKAIKQQLLSDNRYNKCHEMAIKMALNFQSKENFIYVVGGKIAVNENDFFKHSWVEIDNKNLVIDFNHNLIMDRDQYYRLFSTKIISKTNVNDLKKILKIVYKDLSLDLHPILINYFGMEIMNDINKRNIKQIKA